VALLITGATGHLGPHLIAELLRAGDFDRLYVAARRNGGSSAARVNALERAAASLEAASTASMRTTLVPVDADLPAGGLAVPFDDITAIVHAAADTRFAAPLEVLRRSNVEGTRAVCDLAARCPHLQQLLFVSTACVAGRRTGVIREEMQDDSAGFANAYEQTKWEAERLVAASGLPARIARLTTCAGSHATGYVHRFGALHHLLHWMARGLVPMVPGTVATPIDVISTDVAAAWLARAVTRKPGGLEICHVALGERAIPLGELLDLVFPLLAGDRGAPVQRPILVDEDVFESFTRMVRLSGDALLARVQDAAASVLPSLLHPKQYETQAAERCWGGPLPHADWRTLFSQVIAYARAQRWGFVAAAEVCHA